MVLHNPNNWHWVNKDVSEWAKEYLTENLTQLEAEKGDVSAKIEKITTMEGDVDVSQRKGKVITLFDIKLVLEFEGCTKENEGITGTITIPEVAHDTEEDEYVFDIDIHSPSKTKEPINGLIRSELVPKIRTALQKLAPALIAEHGQGLQHAPGTGPPTGYTTPVNKTTSSSAAQSVNRSTAASASSSSKGKAFSTSAVTSTTEFRTTASELYTTFTDPGRITALTRSPPSVFEGAKPGGKFAIFGGGVTGEYVSLKEPTQIVQKWRLSHWPEGHYTTLTLDFDQDNVNSVTNMKVTWDKVPVGEEESTKGKWGEYYVRSLMTTFGFGTIL